MEGDRPTTEIAYRKWIFRGGGEQFTWNVFALGADQGLAPYQFNIHDSTNELEAGSPNKGDANYPIKSLAAIDNTCRVPMGFEATGSEPLGCLVKGPEPTGDDGDDNGDEFCSQFPKSAVAERHHNCLQDLSSVRLQMEVPIRLLFNKK